ncbi:exodeoxyribonuclease III [Ferroplasma acidiphilum]|jgi:exodeoxyribonuclease-3|uniref:exodeoxyribonuclease III n=1 Tax=Ferroplasma acidiphilum TaxID=74969 RepID=UPI0023F169A5|nr:exodeoxyribonuclease III [Ferroplasma acidiphilum]MCL4349093.1 exodeoxyribonuclease III [Candidatus Thermoplasmatota archaeon]
MKILSWNVNGIRAAVKNGIIKTFENENPDIILLQEVKADKMDIPEELHHAGYKIYVNPADKKGYSGTMVMAKQEPLSYNTGTGENNKDVEGRIQTLEYDNFYLINSYFPNSQHGLTRLDYKIQFNRGILEYMDKLKARKPVIITGDFNVAHEEIDIARPKGNEKNAGFTIEERDSMTEILSHGYIDTYRYFHKEPGHYSWWSYRFNAREKNIGWRIDYFLVSDNFIGKVQDSLILENISGSDHAPLELILKQ